MDEYDKMHYWYNYDRMIFDLLLYINHYLIQDRVVIFVDGMMKNIFV